MSEEVGIVTEKDESKENGDTGKEEGAEMENSIIENEKKSNEEEEKT